MVSEGDKGFIVIGDDGLPVFFPFGAATNPCDPDPEMLLTVAGTTGTISWCGQTWNLPTDSGVQKSVCPTLYTNNQSYVNNTSVGQKLYNGTEVWKYNASLRMKLQYRLWWSALQAPSPYFLPNFSNTYYLYMNKTAKYDLGFFSHAYSPGPRPIGASAAFGIAASPLGQVNTAEIISQVTYSNHGVTDSFFGEVTVGGIVYTWARGKGW